MMNILMVGYTFYDTDTRVIRYAESLAEKGHIIDFVGIKVNKNTPARYVFNNNINIYNIQFREINEKSKIDYVKRLISFFLKTFFFITINFFRKRYKFIHVHNMPDFEVFATLIPRLFGSKIILDIHDLFPELYSNKFTKSSKETFLFKIFVFIERISCLWAHHVIISNHLWWEKITMRSVKKEKCTTIINYPDSKIFHRRSPQKEKNTNRYLLFYHGTISRHQGLDIAVNAVSKLIKDFNFDFVEFHIYGNGPEKENLLKQIEILNLVNKIKIFDTLPLEEIVLKIEEADLGIIPKRNDIFGGEAFSTKILEFMLMEIPVIVAATKIDLYYFNDNIVTFFEPENSSHLAAQIKFCIDNPLITQQKIKNAKRFVDDLTWDKKKIEYLQIVSNLTGEI